jgi:hypothetical protein
LHLQMVELFKRLQPPPSNDPSDNWKRVIIINKKCARVADHPIHRSDSACGGQASAPPRTASPRQALPSGGGQRANSLIQNSPQCARVQLALPTTSEQANAPPRDTAAGPPQRWGWRNGGHGATALAEGQRCAVASVAQACSTRGRLPLPSYPAGG